MVKGLDIFRDHFRGFDDRYILIGGTACFLALNGAGLVFRATKDLDLVICVEALGDDFISRFWEFVAAGKYSHLQKGADKKQFYRFSKPKNDAFPFMLELFCRKPDILDELKSGYTVTPLPASDSASSLSAILLDDTYYDFIRDGKIETDGLPVLAPEYTIPLKASAWLDLTGRKTAGESIDTRDIRKHKNDVFRLFLITAPGRIPVLPGKIAADMVRFLDAIIYEPVELKPFGYPAGTPYIDTVREIRDAYRLV